MKLPLSVVELAKICNGKLNGQTNQDQTVKGFATLKQAGVSDIAFFTGSPSYCDDFANTKALVVVTKKSEAKSRNGLSIVVNNDPRECFSNALNQCTDKGRKFTAGIEPTANIDPTAKLAKDVHIAAGVVIAKGVSIGARSKVLANAVITEDCQIGEDCLLHEGCVVGSEGFGFYYDQGKHERITHIGSVVIGDQVEVGANTTIDRGVLGNTQIGSGTKIDNLVQIGHNVNLGQNVLICGTCAIGGSTTIGDGSVLGGAVKVVNNCHIAKDVKVLGGSSVISNINDAGVFGSVIPQMPVSSLRRLWKMWLKKGRE